MKNKTNAMRMLDSAQIEYKEIEYIVDENDLSGMHIARQINMDPDMMFKTIVARGEKKGAYGFLYPCFM
jgi:Cys-tRNA(Pro)/Cys-tRNA(Cys) deacylase